MTRTAIAAAAALLLAPGALRASTICAGSDPAGFYACASVQVSWNSGALILSVKNLDTWDATLSSVVGAYRLNAVGVFGTPSIASYLTGQVTVSTSGSVGGTAQSSSWGFSTIGGGISVQAGAETTGPGQHGFIQGCMAVGGSAKRFITCPGQGYGGAVVFTFNTNADYSAEFARTTWGYGLRGNAGPNGVSFKCDDWDGVPNSAGDPRLCTPPPPPPPPTTVPEPFTMVLLGTGLAAVGGAARRRRRTNPEA